MDGGKGGRGIAVVLGGDGRHRQVEVLDDSLIRGQDQTAEVRFLQCKGAVAVVDPRRQAGAEGQAADDDRQGFRTVRIGKGAGDLQLI